MTTSIASALKDNRRLTTFKIEKPEEFVAYMRTRYDSEIEGWLSLCREDDWKYMFLIQEQKLRALERRVRQLQELAEVW